MITTAMLTSFRELSFLLRCQPDSHLRIRILLVMSQSPSGGNPFDGSGSITHQLTRMRTLFLTGTQSGRCEWNASPWRVEILTEKSVDEPSCHFPLLSVLAPCDEFGERSMSSVERANISATSDRNRKCGPSSANEYWRRSAITALLSFFAPSHSFGW